jgi:hypothetical protein
MVTPVSTVQVSSQIQKPGLVITDSSQLGGLRGRHDHHQAITPPRSGPGRAPVKTAALPGVTWEVRLAWGTRALAAELVSPARPLLRLGNAPGDDVFTGRSGGLELALEGDASLSVRFSAQVEGLVALRGHAPRPLGELVRLGLASEAEGRWVVRLSPGDAAELVVGDVSVHLRQARGRYQRLPFDVRHLGVLVLAVAFLVGLLFTALSQLPPSFRTLVPPRPTAPGR